MERCKSAFRLKELKIEVTHDCTLRCAHCSSVAGANSGRSLEWPSCERIINYTVAMGVLEIDFSGGEPLFWEHIQMLLHHRKDLRRESLSRQLGDFS